MLLVDSPVTLLPSTLNVKVRSIWPCGPSAVAFQLPEISAAKAVSAHTASKVKRGFIAETPFGKYITSAGARPAAGCCRRIGPSGGDCERLRYHAEERSAEHGVSCDLARNSGPERRHPWTDVEPDVREALAGQVERELAKRSFAGAMVYFLTTLVIA